MVYSSLGIVNETVRVLSLVYPGCVPISWLIGAVRGIKGLTGVMDDGSALE